MAGTVPKRCLEALASNREATQFKPGNKAAVGHGRPTLKSRLRRFVADAETWEDFKVGFKAAIRSGDLTFEALEKLLPFDPRDEKEDGESTGRAGTSKQSAINDPYAFAVRYWPEMVSDAEGNLIPPADFHQQFYEAVKNLNGGKTRYALAAPREHAKTTIAEIACAWLLFTGRRKFALWFGASQDDAETRIEDIAELAGSKLLQSDTGTKVAESRADELVLSNGSRVMACGWESSKRGKKRGAIRPDIIFLDDIEKDERIDSLTQRQKNERRFLRAVSNLGKNADIFYIGTILHYDSMLAIRTDAAKAKEHGIGPWAGTRLAAEHTDDSGSRIALWPEMWSLADLDAKRHEIGSVAYNCEYLNNPVDDDTAYFQPAWFKFFQCDDPDKPNYISRTITLNGLVVPAFEFYGFCDPALKTKEKNDFCCIATIGRHRESGRLYAFEVLRGKWPLQTIAQMVVQNHIKYNYQGFGIEDVALQSAFKQVVDEESRRQTANVPTYLLPIHTDNMQRIKCLSPLVENGTLQFEQHLLNHALYEELVHLGHTDHDDAPVSVEGAVRLCKMLQSGTQQGGSFRSR